MNKKIKKQNNNFIPLTESEQYKLSINIVFNMIRYHVIFKEILTTDKMADDLNVHVKLINNILLGNKDVPIILYEKVLKFTEDKLNYK